MPMSTYLKNKVIGVTLNGGVNGVTNLLVPNIWISLYTGNPDVVSSIPEVTGGSYSRVQVPQSILTGFNNPSSNGIASNQAAIEFARATADWGNITHVGVADALTGGNLLYYGTMVNHPTGVAILVDEIFRLQAGEIVITLV